MTAVTRDPFHAAVAPQTVLDRDNRASGNGRRGGRGTGIIGILLVVLGIFAGGNFALIVREVVSLIAAGFLQLMGQRRTQSSPQPDRGATLRGPLSG